MMRASLVTAALAGGLVGGAGCPAAARPGVTTLRPGTYRQVDPRTGHPFAVGNRIVIRASRPGRLAFTLDAVRQLDFNIGTVAGELPARLPSTWTKRATSGDCRLRVTAATRGLRIVQDSRFGDCGFGYGVVADGTYIRTGDAPPGASAAYSNFTR